MKNINRVINIKDLKYKKDQKKVDRESVVSILLSTLNDLKSYPDIDQVENISEDIKSIIKDLRSIK